jgi:hypothetical protein
LPLHGLSRYWPRVIAQSERRVLSGQAVPASEKLVSLFEPHADIIRKGGRQVQYGHKLNLVTGKSGLILDVVVEAGNPADAERFLPMLAALVIARYIAIPASRLSPRSAARYRPRWSSISDQNAIISATKAASSGRAGNAPGPRATAAFGSTLDRGCGGKASSTDIRSQRPEQITDEPVTPARFACSAERAEAPNLHWAG